MDASTKPHAVCVPFPAQGHVNPMLKVAKLLHHKGFHITFVNTEFNHQRLLNARGSDSLKGLPDFHFKAIPDGLPSSDINATQDIPALCESTKKNCLVPFRQVLAQLNNSSLSDCPPVSCIVSDGVMSFTLDAAQELGVPEVLFWTPSACGVMGYFHYRFLVEAGFTPLKDEGYLTNGYLDTTIDSIPGMKGIRLRDLPTLIRTTDPNDFLLKFAIEETERASMATAIILNTFDDIESEVLEAMKSLISPPIYTIGPLQLLLHDQVKDINALTSLGSNLWKEDPECLKWLDSKEPNSVVYVNFGSITVMTPDQLIEFAWGLAKSNQPFLWIIRPDLVRGEKAILPPEFTIETKERSKISNWCPQELVLNHPSIGGFLTHSGWNSTLETVCSGVPILSWPFFAEQQTNCRYSYIKWDIGMEIDNNVKRDEVERLVRELMEGDKGKQMKKSTMEWKKKAEEAAKPGGSSYVNFDKLVKDVLLRPKK